jgi:hypothetical protein
MAADYGHEPCILPGAYLCQIVLALHAWQFFGQFSPTSNVINVTPCVLCSVPVFILIFVALI